MTYQCLRNGNIHAVHGHVIAIVGSPAKSQLRHVTGSDHHAAHLVGDIHQDLGTLSGLSVFVGHIMDRNVVADILKMTGHRRLDIDLL